MNPKQEQKRDRILKAALDCFGQYGFKRTSMDDIAQKADISRAALYGLFQNKEDIFRTLSEQLHGMAVARAEAVLKSDAPFSDRLVAAFEAKDLELVELIDSSPHGAELVDVNSAIGAEIRQAAEKRFTQLLIEAICQAERKGEIEFTRVTFNATQFAEVLIVSTYGLKKSFTSGAEYRQRLEHLISAFNAALKAYDTTRV
jgi:AcrR family transcriptional regulator